MVGGDLLVIAEGAGVRRSVADNALSFEVVLESGEGELGGCWLHGEGSF